MNWYTMETVHETQNIYLINNKDKQDLFDKYKISWSLFDLDF